MMTQDTIDRTIDNRVSNQAAESTFREVDDTDRAIPAIEFRNVTMIYDDRAVLNDLSFKVMKGETKIILGGSGCGKSTTIKLVLGLIKPNSGQILVEGEDITNYNENQMMKVRRKLGKALGAIDPVALRRGTELLRAGTLKPRGGKED